MGKQKRCNDCGMTEIENSQKKCPNCKEKLDNITKIQQEVQEANQSILETNIIFQILPRFYKHL